MFCLLIYFPTNMFMILLYIIFLFLEQSQQYNCTLSRCTYTCTHTLHLIRYVSKNIKLYINIFNRQKSIHKENICKQCQTIFTDSYLFNCFCGTSISLKEPPKRINKILIIYLREICIQLLIFDSFILFYFSVSSHTTDYGPLLTPPPPTTPTPHRSSSAVLQCYSIGCRIFLIQLY